MRLPVVVTDDPNTIMDKAMQSNKSADPFGPDTRSNAEVNSQYENSLPTNMRNLRVNQRRKADKARKAAKKARRRNRR